MNRDGRYGSTVVSDTNRVGRYGSISDFGLDLKPFNLNEPEKQTVAKTTVPSVKKEVPSAENNYGLPETTISQAKPQQEEKSSLWKKVARTVLPKGAEEYFGLTKPRDPTIKERVQKAEDAKQSLFRGQRREENISQVKAPVEEYTPPTSFFGKLQEVFKYGGYGKNVWSGFIKPAIGIISEQAGLQMNDPELRKWGEQFADKTFEREKRKASAQSMADIPGTFEGGLKDPRYYSKTISQSTGFMATIFGTSLVVTAVTKNPGAGTAAGIAVGASLEDANAYQAMIDKGVSPDDANTAAQVYGTISSVIENSTGIRPAGGMKGLAEDFAVTASKSKAVKNFFKKWFEEGVLEEGSQQLVENLVNKFVDDNQEVFDGVGESMVSGLVGSFPIVGGGTVMSNRQAQEQLKKLPQPGLSIKDVSDEQSSLFATEPKIDEEPLELIDAANTSYTSAIQNLPPDIASTIEPLEQVLEGEKNTPIKERIRWVDYLRTPWKVFDRMGIRGSYEKLLESYEGYVKELPDNINKVTEWSKQVSPEANEKIFRYLDGEDVVLAPNEAKVANEIKTYLTGWADRLGIEKDERISEYITHIFPLKKGGEIPEEISVLINKKTPGSVYDPFLLQRKGAEGYIKDTWAALDAYTKRATRKAHMDPALKSVKEDEAKLSNVSQLNYLNKYVGAINLRPTGLDTLIDNHIKEKFGFFFGARPTAAITRTIRKTIARAKIGGSITSLAKNLTQGVNTFAELGTFYTTKGYVDLVKFGAKELHENGVLIEPFIEDRTYNAIKSAAEKFDKVLFANMNASELVNRGAAYYGAKAKFLNGKITNKEYRASFGKDKPANYQPTMEDAIKYGKFVSAKTQFLFGALDTPVALNSDIAKMVAQFQTFGLKETEFIADMYNNKEWLKLTRYITSSMLLFQYIASAFGMSWDDSFKTLRFGMPPAIQFFMDLRKSGIMGEDKYGNILSNEDRAKLVGKSLFTNIMPGGTQIKKSYEGFKAVDEGAVRSKSGKLQYKVDQGPANYIRGTLFGKYNLPESKKYYKERDKKAKENTKNKKETSRKGRY